MVGGEWLINYGLSFLMVNDQWLMVNFFMVPRCIV